MDTNCDSTSLRVSHAFRVFGSRVNDFDRVGSGRVASREPNGAGTHRNDVQLLFERRNVPALRDDIAAAFVKCVISRSDK